MMVLVVNGTKLQGDLAGCVRMGPSTLAPCLNPYPHATARRKLGIDRAAYVSS